MQIDCITICDHCKTINKYKTMKIINKQIQRAENITLVQLESLEGEGFGFRPAAQAIEKGGLVIKEVRQEGSVNTLLAINQTKSLLVLLHKIF